MAPLYAYKLAKKNLKVKGIVNFSNLSNPWLNHLSYAPNMVYKRLITKEKPLYNTLDKTAKFCNLFSVLGSPNAENYCENLNDLADEHVLDIFSGNSAPEKFDPNTRVTRNEKKIERWMNTERVRKYFGANKRFRNVNKKVFSVVTQNDNRLIATDAVMTALLNRNIGVYYFVGSIGRTANWIGNLMSAVRQTWVGQKEFEKADWELWNRKNDIKEYGPLKFARVFGRSYDFWQGNSEELSKFLDEYVLKVVPTKAEKEGRQYPSNPEPENVKEKILKKNSGNVEEENERIAKKQQELINRAKTMSQKDYA